MRSSTGQHFLALDHVRAVAAWLVFVWHFHHGNPAAAPRIQIPTMLPPMGIGAAMQNSLESWIFLLASTSPGVLAGSPIPFSNAPSVWPASLLDEGHTGVALFMTLSGYLFAKLLAGRDVRFGSFLWNRALRLLPLLLLVLAIVGAMTIRAGEATLLEYLAFLAKGLLLPTLPNGAWSITVELHFYILLPLLLLASRRSSWPLAAAIAATIAIRAAIWTVEGTVQTLAYSTLVGRFDQFACGILALRHRDAIARRWPWAAFAILAFVALFHRFDANGGYYGASGYPTEDPAWIALPTIEGIGYACAIALYDGLCKPQDRGFSALLGRIGAYSYSIYLLHFFVVFHLAEATTRWLGPNPNFAACTAIATLAFVAMTPIGWLSYRFLESPFLRLRKPYLR